MNTFVQAIAFASQRCNDHNKVHRFGLGRVVYNQTNVLASSARHDIAYDYVEHFDQLQPVEGANGVGFEVSNVHLKSPTLRNLTGPQFDVPSQTFGRGK
jgi:hypothetical protein